MRRRRSAQTTLTPSLFPFLAVLICTMGALIALLVLGVQQAHVHAEVVVQHQESRTKEQEQREEEDRLKRENFIWQQEILEEQRVEAMIVQAGEVFPTPQTHTEFKAIEGR